MVPGDASGDLEGGRGVQAQHHAGGAREATAHRRVCVQATARHARDEALEDWPGLV